MRLTVTAVLAATLLGSTASSAAGQLVLDRPKFEVGLRATNVAQPESPGVGAGVQLTWNLDSHTAIEGSTDFLHQTGLSRTQSRLAYVQLKRSLFAGDVGRLFVTAGAAGGYRRYGIPTQSFTDRFGTVTFPGHVTRTTQLGLTTGVGFDKALGSCLSLEVATQFLFGDHPALRTTVGVSVPVGRLRGVAPTAPSRLAQFSRVTRGQTAWVTTSDGKEWSGRVARVTDSSIELTRQGKLTVLPAANISRIEGPDPVIDGARRGALAGLVAGGATGGVIAFAQCENDYCGRYAVGTGLLWGGIGAGMGAAIGAISDSLHSSRRTLYDASVTRIALQPIVMKRGAGIGGTVTWR